MAELKKLLKERGLSTTGNKSNLLERLSNAGDSQYKVYLYLFLVFMIICCKQLTNSWFKLAQSGNVCHFILFWYVCCHYLQFVCLTGLNFWSYSSLDQISKKQPWEIIGAGCYCHCLSHGRPTVLNWSTEGKYFSMLVRGMWCWLFLLVCFNGNPSWVTVNFIYSWSM